MRNRSHGILTGYQHLPEGEVHRYSNWMPPWVDFINQFNETLIQIDFLMLCFLQSFKSNF